MSLLQHKNFIFSIGILLLLSCKETNESQQLIPEPTAVEKEISTSPLSYDQILGALVGSAIGDAMGASTEMWNREDIYKTYGYISTLTPAYAFNLRKALGITTYLQVRVQTTPDGSF